MSDAAHRFIRAARCAREFAPVSEHATRCSAGSASARGAATSATRASTSPRRSSRPTAGSAARIREALGILVLALMIAQRQGSSRLPLDPRRAGCETLVGEILRVAGLELDTARIVKRITALTATPGFNSVIGIGDARLPLIVDDGCLYTERSRYLEQRVAERLAARLACTRRSTRRAIARRSRSRGPAPAALSAEQRDAVELALAGSLTVVTGGPGTGKTLVAAAIVRGFARLGVPPIQIALAAQTGKAANRLTEVIGQQLAAVASPADADRALAASPPAAQTLHRLLGYRGDGFAHHAQSPLPVGAVIVDEASMVDLELMDALLDALPADAPLVLIGDAHQLPAIDAGQILADLAEPDGRRERCVALLEHSYRMDAADPRGRAVLEAARAVHAGEAHKLTEKHGARRRTARPARCSGRAREWVDTRRSSVASRPCTRVAASAVAPLRRPARAARSRTIRCSGSTTAASIPRRPPSSRRCGSCSARARMLTVTRGMPTGSLALNAYVHELALERMTVTGRPDFVPGEPVMITANDYQRGLFNGDQGIIVRADEGGGRHRYRAVFRVAGQLVPFAIEALRDRLELAWALTVHKSQGSELDALALVLPDDDTCRSSRASCSTPASRARERPPCCAAPKPRSSPPASAARCATPGSRRPPAR